MTGWLQLTDHQRRTSIDQAARIGGRSAKAIEKDWWVTLTLKALFAMPEATYFTFKGGTSLAKCWKLIQRFSEDIDLALSPQAFDMKSENHPGSAYLSRLKKRGCEYTSTKLKAGLESSFASMGVVPGAVEIQAASIMEGMPDKDPQTLSVNYISLYEHNSYLPDSVKIEVSVRSLRGPQAEMAVQSMLHELYPNAAYAEIPFMVASIEPQQTFLEKTFLLHEEFLKPVAEREIRTVRMSRHLYDIEKMMDAVFERKALADPGLYESVIEHRKKYSRHNWLDYSTLDRHSICFLPPSHVNQEYKKDYEVMKEEMIFGNALEYDELLNRLQELLERFRNE